MNHKIVESSLALFLARGFHKVNTDEIAQAAGISKRTLYRYFPSKDELVTATLEHFKMQVRTKFVLVLSQKELPPLHRFRQILTQVAQELSKVSRSLMVDLQRERPDIFAQMVEFRTANIRSLIGLLKEAREKKEINPDIDVPFAIDMLLASINTLLIPEYLVSHNYSFEFGLEKITQIFLDGIKIGENKHPSKRRKI
ncbi:TetR/AcrR family transcriptional regulator [Leptospira inadai]|uniref:TetR/AcrR family transcriptional regulator n=1 Tax=Leptospira inadai serovar Lyme TaxID=293084 RepID=A0ABX4YJQ2_9LEPT|nr:TetR/AcrR family transcriptional regulator [Leptospira inadai]PNV75523.1 TetR/AcrR family transcriptional regulator [Leptospira inadai serovar Lyme]